MHGIAHGLSGVDEDAVKRLDKVREMIEEYAKNVNYLSRRESRMRETNDNVFSRVRIIYLCNILLMIASAA